MGKTLRILVWGILVFSLSIGAYAEDSEGGEVLKDTNISASGETGEGDVPSTKLDIEGGYAEGIATVSGGNALSSDDSTSDENEIPDEFWGNAELKIDGFTSNSTWIKYFGHGLGEEIVDYHIEGIVRTWWWNVDDATELDGILYDPDLCKIRWTGRNYDENQINLKNENYQAYFKEFWRITKEPAVIEPPDPPPPVEPPDPPPPVEPPDPPPPVVPPDPPPVEPPDPPPVVPPDPPPDEPNVPDEFWGNDELRIDGFVSDNKWIIYFGHGLGEEIIDDHIEGTTRIWWWNVDDATELDEILYDPDLCKIRWAGGDYDNDQIDLENENYQAYFKELWKITKEPAVIDLIEDDSDEKPVAEFTFYHNLCEAATDDAIEIFVYPNANQLIIGLTIAYDGERYYWHEGVNSDNLVDKLDTLLGLMEHENWFTGTEALS